MLLLLLLSFRPVLNLLHSSGSSLFRFFSCTPSTCSTPPSLQPCSRLNSCCSVSCPHWYTDSLSPSACSASKSATSGFMFVSQPCSYPSLCSIALLRTFIAPTPKSVSRLSPKTLAHLFSQLTTRSSELARVPRNHCPAQCQLPSMRPRAWSGRQGGCNGCSTLAGSPDSAGVHREWELGGRPSDLCRCSHG
eukprot:753921-Hanusia_phi.AAC.1